MKRILAVAVCIAMILPLLPVIGSAAVVSEDVYYDFNDYSGATSYKSCSFGTSPDYGVADESRGISIKRYCNTVGEYINASFELNSNGVFGFSYCPNDTNLWVGIGAKGSSGQWDETALQNIITLNGASIKAGSDVIYTGEIGKWTAVAIGIDFTGHKVAVFVNGNPVHYATISESVTKTQYFNFNIAKDKKSDTYVEGDDELTNEDYASVWFDDMFTYLSDSKAVADVGSSGADPLKASEINIDFGEKVMCPELTGAVTLNGDAVDAEAVMEHGYLTGIKLSGLSLTEKTAYTIAFPGIVDALNKEIAPVEFTTGLSGKTFAIYVDGADETYPQDTKIIVDITTENITEDIEIWHNGALLQTVSPNTQSVGVILAAGENTICAKVPSLDFTSNTVTIEAVPYEIVKTYVDEDMEDSKLSGGLNIGPKYADGTSIWSIVDTDAEHGKSLYVEKDKDTELANSNAPYVNYTSAKAAMGVYVYEADIKYSQVDKAGVFFSLKTEDSAGAGQWKNAMYSLSDGNITVGSATIATIEADKWYNFKVTYDMSHKTSEFYVNGVRVAKDIPMGYKDFANVLYVNMGIPIIDGTTTYMYMDNIKAYFKAKKFDVDVNFGEDASNNVSVDNGVINLSFDQIVDASALTDVTLYGSDGSQLMTGFTTSDNMNFTAPLSGLNRSTAYTLDLSGVTTAAGLGGNVSEIKFSTEKTPVIFEAEDIISANGGANVGRTLFMDNTDYSKLSDVTGVTLDNNFMNESTFTDENLASIYAKNEGLVLDVDKLAEDGKIVVNADYIIFAKASSLASESQDSFYSYKTYADASGAFLNTFAGVNAGSRGYPAYYGIPGITMSAHVEGRGYTAANGDIAWVKVGDTTLKSGEKLWFIGREQAFIDKVMLVPASLAYTVTEAAAYEAENVTTYTASFVANGKTYYTIEFEPGTTQLSNRIFFKTEFKEYTAVSPRDEWAAANPDYATYFDYNPSTEEQAYKWEHYSLPDSDITVNAVESNGAIPVLDSIFNNGMMLQRNKNVNIYGECPVDGVEITVSILGQTKTATVADGKWEVVLDPMEATDSTTLTVSAVGGESITYSDVAVGEIWLCMGQSNMNQRLNTMEDYADYKDDMINNNIRLFTMTQTGAMTKQDDVTNGTWYKSTSSNAGQFSAVAYVMAEKLHKTLGVPVGLVMPCRGGTGINVWISEEILRSRDEYDAYEAIYDAADVNGTYTTDEYHQIPTTFYNNMVYPLMPYTVSGAIWYQGCNNKNDDQNVYKLMFRDMVANWRDGFENPEMPVITFQLAPYNDNFMAMRQTQFELAKEDDNVYLVTTAYEGYTRTAEDEESGAIHPYRKSPLGKRAAHIALNNVYGNTSMGEEYYPPYGVDAKTVNGVMYVEMAHAGTGLVIDTTTFDNLEGFDVSEDGAVWSNATATIESDGKTVKLVSDSVSTPKYARYGYAKEVIEYTDRTSSTSYDETKNLLRATLGGNLTNNTGYPSFAFALEASSVTDTRASSGDLGDNVLFMADGSEFLNADGSYNAFENNAVNVTFNNSTKNAVSSIATVPVDVNGTYGEALKLDVNTDVGSTTAIRFDMPEGRMGESFTFGFDCYSGNNFKFNLRPYYYKTDATSLSNTLLMKQKWNNLVSSDEKTKYASNNKDVWTRVEVAIDVENDCARLYINGALTDTVAMPDLDAISYILFGLEAASNGTTTDEAGNTVNAYHETTGYLDNVYAIKTPDITSSVANIKVIDTLLSRKDSDLSDIKFKFTNNAGATVTTEYEDVYHGNVIKYYLPAGVTNSNLYGVIGTQGATESVTTTDGKTWSELLPSEGKEFVFEIDIKFDDFNNSKSYGAMNHFYKTSVDATAYTRGSTINPFAITTKGALKFGNDVVAQLETGKWYSFRAVYDMGTEDTDIPMVKAYFNGRYLGEIRAANNSNAYHNVDYIGYITYNHAATGELTSSLAVDNIRFYTTTTVEASEALSYVEYFAAYQNGAPVGSKFSDGAITFEALWQANCVDSSNITMIAARYRGNELIGIATETHAVGAKSKKISVTLPDDMMQDVTSEDYIKVMFTDGSNVRPLAEAIGGVQ